MRGPTFLMLYTAALGLGAALWFHSSALFWLSGVSLGAGFVMAGVDRSDRKSAAK